MIEREFASRMLASTEAALVRARNDAMRQLLYLERLVQPHRSDRSTQPKRVRIILTVFAANCMLLMIGWLFYSGLRDHGAVP